LQYWSICCYNETGTMTFDAEKFYQSVDEHRTAEGISWRGLGRQLGISPSTFSRMSRGRQPDVDTFLKLLAWLDMPAEHFMANVPGKRQRGRAALSVITAALRRDPNLDPSRVEPLEEIMRAAYNTFKRLAR
jgi:transcriptional regulator with XRE-family HTH domain